MENNETNVCKFRSFCKSKPILVIVVACVVCFFVGFFSGNIAGKSAQKKADARIIAAANARANAARYRRIGNIQRTPNVRTSRVNPQTARRANTPRPVARPANVNRPVAKTQTRK